MSPSRAPRRKQTVGRWAVGLAALACAVASGCIRPQSAPTVHVAAPVAQARVEGLVATYREGGFQPVAGAEVTVGGQMVVTGPDGRYTLDAVEPGTRPLIVRRAGFAPDAHEIIVMPGVGTPRANVLLREARYAVQQAATFDAVVSGTVVDPRGAALANADVILDCPRAHGGAGAHLATRTNADGFFAATLANVTPGATSASVTYSASGTSPGGVPLSTEADDTADLTGPHLVLNVQALKFPDLQPQTIVGSAFVLPGAEGKVSESALSTRADEFYLQLVSGGDRLDALPTAVDPGQASFRMPFGLSDTAVRVVIVPFGRTPKASDPSPPFITSYTAADLDRDLTFAPAGTMEDLTPLANTVNDTRFIGGDRARFTLTIANANTLVPQDLELTGKVPVGTVIETVTVGGSAVPFEGPDATGAWRAWGFQMPMAGSLDFKMEVKSVPKLANGIPFAVTNLALKMPSLNLTKPVPPPDSPIIPTGGIDTAAFTIAKQIEDDGIPGNGIARVVLTLTPVNSLAGASFRLTDVVQTETESPATAARFEGTAVLPPPGVPLGLQTGDHLNLTIDGLPATVQIFGPGYDAETLIGQINTTVGVGSYVGANRTGTDTISLTRVQQGFGKTLGILPTTSPSILAALGLTPGTKGSGYYGDFAGVSVTQPNGTTWTLAVVNGTNKWSGNAQQAMIIIRPPTTYKPGDGPDSPITIKYFLRKLNGQPGLGGGGAMPIFGTKMVSYNLIYSTLLAADDQTFTKAAPDAASVSGW